MEIAVGGILFIVFIAVVIAAATIALFVWWILTLVHVVKHEDAPDRTLWILLHTIGMVLGFGLIVPPVYYFAVQKQYDRDHASGGHGHGPKAPSA